MSGECDRAGDEIAERRPLRGEHGPWLIRAGNTTAVLKVMPREDRSYVATEVAALELAEKYRVAAPCVIAVDLDGPGGAAPLSTFLRGTSRVSPIADPKQLRALGAAAGRSTTCSSRRRGSFQFASATCRGWTSSPSDRPGSSPRRRRSTKQAHGFT